jgi:hypothetical protein
MIGQDIWQRVFTARSPAIARWGSVVAGVYCLAYALAGALVGAATRVILPDLQSADNAFARIATEALPAGITGLVLSAALAAVMSTASAGLLACSTVLANDVYAGFVAHGERNEVLVNCVTTLLVGVAVLVTAIAVSDVIGALTVVYDLLTGALFVPTWGAVLEARHHRWRPGVHGGEQCRRDNTPLHPGALLERPHHLRDGVEPRRLRGSEPRRLRGGELPYAQALRRAHGGLGTAADRGGNHAG